ncbi:MAG: hypothetical protein L6Q92_05475 [Phycisphaerae bacterium]|nr:hypothetical protein [Phycisphaerae bacterium]
MSSAPTGTPESVPDARHLSELPRDELLRYGRELGLELPDSIDTPDLVARVRQRQELLLGLDREAMLDVVVWARRPVRRSASKETLAKGIASIQPVSFDGLSVRGLRVLAAFRGVPYQDSDDAAALRERLARAEGFWTRVSRQRRALVGALLSKLIDGDTGDSPQAYQFLPEDDASARASLRHEIEQRGVVSGLASRLRSAADDYVRQKLDEIEIRIDQKLDQIDRRLSEWRDREVANRLRIIRITLMASVVFAILSLGYHGLKHWVFEGAAGAAPTTSPAVTADSGGSR